MVFKDQNIMIFLARWLLIGCGIFAIFLIIIAITVPLVIILTETATTTTDPTTTMNSMKTDPTTTMNPMTTDLTVMDTTTTKLETTKTDPTTTEPTTQNKVPQENFAQCDTNGDGEIDLAETLAALEKFQNESLTALNSNNYFSNDGNQL